MWNGKMKAVTLSFDDGVMQDKRLVSIFNKYGLKCTFNINSGMMYNECVWNTHGVDVIRMTAQECIDTFQGHEIAGHTLTHPDLSELNDYLFEREIVGDKTNIEWIFGQKVYGMALPGGGNDKRLADLCRKFGIYYARGIVQTESFNIPGNLYNMTTTAHYNNPHIMELANEFIAMNPDTPKMFYIWGHSYELDIHNNWEPFENFCKKISNKDDIFYGTNTEVLKPFFKK